MSIQTARAAEEHVPIVVVYIDDVLVTVPVLDITVDIGIDNPVASASVTFVSPVELQHFGWRRQQVRILLGWKDTTGTYTAPVFTGVLEVRDRDAGQFTRQLTAHGRMSLFRATLNFDEVFNSQTGAQIHAKLLDDCQISNYHLDDEPGGAITFAQFTHVTCARGTVPSEFCDHINTCFEMVLFDMATGDIKRQFVQGLPSAAARVTRRIDSPDFFKLTRQEDISDLRNMVIVQGAPRSDGENIEAGAIAFTPYVIRAMPKIINESILQRNEECQASANILIERVSHPVEKLEYEVIGDPTVQPADVEAVLCPRLGWTTPTNVRVLHIRHSVNAGGGFITSIQAEGSASDEVGTSYGNLERPVAAFDVHVHYNSDLDRFELTVTDRSYDNDGTIVSIAFSNDVTSDTTIVSPYTFNVPGTTTEVTISETVTDNSGLTGNASKTVHLTAGGGTVDGIPPFDNFPAPPVSVVSAPGDGAVLGTGYTAPSGWQNSGFGLLPWVPPVAPDPSTVPGYSLQDYTFCQGAIDCSGTYRLQSSCAVPANPYGWTGFLVGVDPHVVGGGGAFADIAHIGFTGAIGGARFFEGSWGSDDVPTPGWPAAAVGIDLDIDAGLVTTVYVWGGVGGKSPTGTISWKVRAVSSAAPSGSSTGAPPLPAGSSPVSFTTSPSISVGPWEVQQDFSVGNGSVDTAQLQVTAKDPVDLFINGTLIGHIGDDGLGVRQTYDIRSYVVPNQANHFAAQITNGVAGTGSWIAYGITVN